MIIPAFVCAVGCAVASTFEQSSSIILNNGVKMPVVGLGTFMAPDDEVAEAVYAAIEAGYRHIDTAFAYHNHRGVGEALKRAIDKGLVERKDIFLVTKLWMTQFRPDLVRPAVEQMLAELEVDYIDQMLLHWPVPFEHRDPKDDPDWQMPKTPEGHIAADMSINIIDTWRELEKLYDEGKIRSLGISNFEQNEIDELLKEARIKPVVNQVEVHPLWPQERLIKFCKQRGIEVVAYAPLGNPAFQPHGDGPKPNILTVPAVVEIGKRHGKTPAQVAIRWAMQRGTIVIPKSIKPHRVVENFNVFDFDLSPQEMEQIDEIGRDPRHRIRVFNPPMRPNGVPVFSESDAHFDAAELDDAEL
ncbi:hypothetical protein FOZ61_000788 [Perkinsus olseni]|uniref:NADP-dependent oxidoreductase domain-containing protein n=1 Tax=Perkinsus olseni TaxID=32597 RepID=A0A7J6M092_PEROL|nr:hypothetical protein FOZ61_000788 [Perkinsus olseni]KAF4669834.1 hypothetical protein FOL46_001167 [Perkinsus olseni]